MAGLKYARKLIGEGLTVENSVFDTLEETEKYAVEKHIKKLVYVSEKITETVLGVSDDE